MRKRIAATFLALCMLITLIPFRHTSADGGPSITKQPEDITAAAGSSVTWSVEATGTELSYRWQYLYNNAWTDFVGGNNATLTKTVAGSWNGWKIRVIVTDGSGNSVTSNEVTLTIGSNQPEPAVSITMQPEDITAAGGELERVEDPSRRNRWFREQRHIE